MAEPTQFPVGDSLTWTTSVPDYPASDGWALSYFMALPSGPVIQFGSTGNGDDYTVSILAATTQAWAPGTYQWTSRVSKSGEVHTVGRGLFVILPDPTASNDPRSHVRKCLDAITVVIEGRMNDPLAEYKIDGVEAKRIPIEQLLKLQAYYTARVRLESGGPIAKTIRVGLLREPWFNGQPFFDPRFPQ